MLKSYTNKWSDLRDELGLLLIAVAIPLATLPSMIF
jgi:hypothetical protein